MRSSGLHEPCRARSDSTGCWCDIAFAGPASGAPRPRAAAADALDTRAERGPTRSPRLGSFGSIGARTAAKCWSPSTLRVGRAGLRVCQPEASRATWSRSSAAAASPLIAISETRGPGASSGSKGAVLTARLRQDRSGTSTWISTRRLPPPLRCPRRSRSSRSASQTRRAQPAGPKRTVASLPPGSSRRALIHEPCLSPVSPALRARLRGDRAAGRHPQQRERG